MIFAIGDVEPAERLWANRFRGLTRGLLTRPLSEAWGSIRHSNGCSSPSLFHFLLSLAK